MKSIKNSKFIKISLVLFFLYSLALIYLNLNKPLNKSTFKDKILNDTLKLQDILITVKTCSQNYEKRLKTISSTWYQFAKSQIFIIGDDDNITVQKMFGIILLCIIIKY